MPSLAWLRRGSKAEASAECEKCAQIADSFVKELTEAWTALDDHAPPASEQRAAVAAARAIASRIRRRNEARSR